MWYKIGLLLSLFSFSDYFSLAIYFTFIKHSFNFYSCLELTLKVSCKPK